MDVKIILKVHLQQKQVYHIPSGFSMSTISFKSIENKPDVYRSKDSIKKFCESLRKHAMEMISFKKKKKLLTMEQWESRENTKTCYTCTEKCEDKHAKDKKH